jgi:mono/diheme cytochrome c family protein
MFKFSERTLTSCFIAAMIAVSSGAARAADAFPGVGRSATPAEINAWNIDVRPDFLGLPKGSGSVEQGQDVWEAKCASCHGTFGESNKVFSPLIGGVTKEDVAKGHVSALQRTDFPARTTFMKTATVSTLFDYIRRAMPWNAPKSLSDNDVYAVLAYMLNLSDIVPDDFVLDDRTIRDVQKLMPNRDGMTTSMRCGRARSSPASQSRPTRRTPLA